MRSSTVLDILTNLALIACVLFGSEKVGLVAEVVACTICVICLLGMLNPVFRRAAAASGGGVGDGLAMVTAVAFVFTDHVVAAGLYVIVVVMLAHLHEPDSQHVGSAL